MVSHLDLKIFDRDFRILQQLNTVDYKHVDGRGKGGTCVRLRFLIDSGFVESRKGKLGGHKLTCPLSEIPFSHWVNLLEPLAGSPSMKLLSLFEDTSVEDVLSSPPYPNGGWTLSFDHTVGILQRLSTEKPTLSRLLTYPELRPGYIAHIYTEMCRCGLAVPVSRKGIILSKNFDQLTVKDILPMMPHNAQIFSMLAYRASYATLNYLSRD